MSATIFLTKMEDNSHPLLVGTNGSLQFRWMQGFRPRARLPSSPLRVGNLEAMTALRTKLGHTLAALTVFAAAYLAEVMRGGLQGVSPAQVEAANALGIPAWKTVWHIVLPQALQKVIPPLTSTAIVMVKNTGLVLIVGVFDMLSASRVAATDPVWSAPYVESYLFVAAVYFLICFGISNYARWLETRVKAKSYR